MNEAMTSVTVSQRRWVEAVEGTRGHYETPTVTVTFPANFLVHYEPTQHTLMVKAPGGQVRAVYRDVVRMLTPDVVLEAPADTP